MKHAFATLDVFTDRRFAGNPLGVVFDADDLDGPTMQAIAREFGHPETVFVLQPKTPATDAQVRIFTPGTELPFAGHPTIGTAVVLALRRGSGGGLVLEEKIGLVKCDVSPAGGDRGHANFVVPALPQQAGAAASHEAIAAALGLGAEDIGFDGHQPAKWSVGNAFTFVPLRNIDAVRRCRIVEADWDRAFEAGGRSFPFVFSSQTLDKANNFHARMFAPRAGVREDPATGSAAAAFAGFCARSLSLADGEHRFVTEQGFEMGRPSLVEFTLTIRGGVLSAASVGGPAIVVTEGTIQT